MALLIVMGDAVAQRLGVDASMSLAERSVVRVGTDALASYGASAVVREAATTGKLVDDGQGGVFLELLAPRPFSRVGTGAGARAVRHLGGVYADVEAFFGTQVPRGMLRFVEVGGRARAVATEFGYPDLDSESGTIVYRLRRLQGSEVGSWADDGRDLAPSVIRDVEVEIHGG